MNRKAWISLAAAVWVGAVGLSTERVAYAGMFDMMDWFFDDDDDDWWRYAGPYGPHGPYRWGGGPYGPVGPYGYGWGAPNGWGAPYGYGYPGMYRNAGAKAAPAPVMPD